MLISEIRSQLAESTLFRQIDIGSLEGFLNSCARHQLMPGDTLIESGSRNTNLYVVITGQLRVYAGGRDLPANAHLGAGDCAGEMSFIDGERSSALVLAAEPSELLAIPHDHMWEMIDAAPVLARNLLAILSGRVRNNNLTLVTTQSCTLEFEQASSVDSLTGLHNRQWIDESFMRMIRRCRNDNAEICLMLADIDLLHLVNERNGFLTGDKALKRIARRLAESLRPQDLIARSGGDVFAVLLPQTRLPVAHGIASRLCTVIAESSIIVPPSHAPMTISSGVVSIHADDDLNSAFTRAEQALQSAKKNGRNRAEQLT